MLHTSELFTDFVQIDIMDGIFVPSKSISSIDIAGVNTRLQWEAHLMVSNPESYVDCFARAGAQQIIFHYEASESHKLLADLIHRSGSKAGIAINPDTSIAVLDPLIDVIDSVLFMSVIPVFTAVNLYPMCWIKLLHSTKNIPDANGDRRRYKRE
jgi:ribulose-phosphate 3-epimerase